MDQRFAEFPRYLAERARRVMLGGVPAMVALPDEGEREGRPVPAVVWMHGRTASKEMDPGRYMRWVRAGMAAVAVDLPGHGERFDAALQEPGATLDVLERMLGELGGVVAALGGVAGIDAARLGIGGMSLGGMVTLRRLCEPHGFAAASVEGTCGWLEGVYFPAEFGMPARAWAVDHPRERVRRLEARSNLAGMSPVPMLVLHSEADEMVSWEAQRRFVEDLRGHYASRGADPGLVRIKTWPETGAPREHIGFGRVSHEAKTLQTEFFAGVLEVK
jgi:dipeptidyl aminopeptidase/acylaminoacyl peptidase